MLQIRKNLEKEMKERAELKAWGELWSARVGKFKIESQIINWTASWSLLSSLQMVSATFFLNKLRLKSSSWHQLKPLICEIILSQCLYKGGIKQFIRGISPRGQSLQDWQYSFYFLLSPKKMRGISNMNIHLLFTLLLFRRRNLK